MCGKLGPGKPADHKAFRGRFWGGPYVSMAYPRFSQTKTVHTYYNWLMGYGIDDNNIPEIVLIPVDPKWDWIDEPIYCKKTNSEMTQDKKTSLFILKNDQLEDGKIDLQLISSVAMMENYLMDVNYMFDYEKLSEYCMKYWMGK